MKRSTLYVILGAIVAAAALGVGIWRSRLSPQPEEEVPSAVVERGTLLVSVSASGTIEPLARVGLAWEAPGRVAKVSVEVGDTVEPGDVLARLDTEQLTLQVEQAEAALALTEAQLAQLQAGPQPDEIASAKANLSAAQAQLSAAAANRDQLEAGPTDAQIASAEAQVASARMQKKAAQDTYDAIAKGGTRKEQANYRLYAAGKALEAAQAELDRLLAGADADEIRAARSNVRAAAAQRDAAQAQLDLLLAGPTNEQVADAEAQVAQAQAALDLAQLSLERAALRAPFEGVAAEVNVTAGEMTSTGRPHIVLLDASRFRVVASVDEMDVGQLSVGMTARVTPDALPDTVITGTVNRIAPAAKLEQGVTHYDVAVELASTDAPIRTDMTTSVTILVEELTDVLKIPTWVLNVDPHTGQTYVHRRVAGNIERVDVEIGARHEGVAQVLGGLAEGDELVRPVPDSTPFRFPQSMNMR